MDLQSKFRCERKYIFPKVNAFNLIANLKTHPGFFREIFPTRKVFSLYFDTPDLLYLHQNILGQTPRTKIRLRWYQQNNQITSPHLEIKYKYGEVNQKNNFLIPSLNKKNLIKLTNNSLSILTKIVSNTLKTKISTANLLNPTLFNHYQRSYFFSNNTHLRITIDQQLHFNHPKMTNQNNINPPISILEAKYDPKYDLNLAEIINFFPLRISKMSKYETGMRLIKL